MKKTHVVLLSALSLYFAACGGGTAAAAGVYELDKAALKQSMVAAMPADQKMPEAMLDGMVNGMNVTVELKADGSASMASKMDFLGQKRDSTATGTWKLDGSKLTITTKDEAGKQDSKTVDYADGVFSFEEDKDGMKMKMTFRRK